MRSFLPVALAVCVALLSASVQGQTPEAKAHFRAGIQAFNDGELDRARRYLESAAAQGLSSRSLSYNLGVVYYRLGLYDKAEQTFRQLIPTRQKALAYYNIGLTALARENRREAEEAFREVLASDPDENLITLARRQLERLDPKTDRTAARKRWAGLVSVGGGYEDNVALFPDTAPKKLDSGFIEALAATSYYLYGDSASGLRSDLKFFSRQYPSEHSFDLQVAQAEARWVQRTSPGQVHVGVGGDYIWRDRRSRERRARLMAGITTRHCPGPGSRCQVKAEATQVFPESEFDAYRGQMYRLDAQYLIRPGDWSAKLKYRAEYNDRDNLETENEFFSVSPERHDIDASLGYALTDSLTLEAGAGFRLSYYRTPHQLRIPEGLLTIQREDKRYTLSVGTTYRFSDRTSFSVELDRTDNDSNIDRYSYDRHTATASVTVGF
ncbi:tetratricopeptide repeat protein [Marinobacter sp. TBZ242]|uniref:Tetratricopeptide repeat protein n=1 Tax=Marinobacter azerbaijanicus TaxID=3050455 RepID=A0ABT7IAQ4_9GAMM|nr:tetratricopeptide repeat protein [Marinobacter sp. TBZ242]MDL0430768.1 tetratricopeptide repeat protein [Marinobacter sp. TBZ242]